MVDVFRATDFPKVQIAYAEAAAANRALHVRIHPGDYEGQALILKSPARPPLLRVQGEGEALRLKLDVAAPVTEIVGLRVSGRLSSGVALKVAGTERVSLKDVRIVGLQLPSASGRSTYGGLQVSAEGPAVDVQLEEFWWIGNDVPDVPIRFSTSSGSNFRSVDVLESVWVDEAERPLIASQVLGDLIVRNSIVFLRGTLLLPSVTKGRITILNSTLALPTVDSVLRSPQKGGALPMEYHPATVKGSEVYAGPDADTDPGTLLDESRVFPPAAWPGEVATQGRALGLTGDMEAVRNWLLP